MDLAVNTLPFWSIAEFTFDLRWSPSLPGGVRTIARAGSRRTVFDYDQDEANVRSLEGRPATRRDTLLTQGGQTRGGSIYQIRGMSWTPDGIPFQKPAQLTADNSLDQLRFVPTNELPANGGQPDLISPTVEQTRGLTAYFVDLLLSSLHFDLRIDGTKRTIPFGPALFYGGVGGTESRVTAGSGLRAWENYMPIPEGITWNPAGASDSNFAVDAIFAYNVISPTFTAADLIDPATGEPYDEELDAVRSSLGRRWTQRYVCNFHGTETAPISAVS